MAAWVLEGLTARLPLGDVQGHSQQKAKGARLLSGDDSYDSRYFLWLARRVCGQEANCTRLLSDRGRLGSAVPAGLVRACSSHSVSSWGDNWSWWVVSRKPLLTRLRPKSPFLLSFKRNLGSLL